VEEYAKLNDSIYWHDGRGVFVNLFVPSELNWTEKGLKLRQETKFPDEGSTAIAVTADKPVQTAIRMRIPSWTSAARVKLNGRALEATAEPGSYLTLDRLWKTGDRIEMEMPMRLSVEAMPDDRQLQAFLYGPLVLAGDLGDEGLNERTIIGTSGPAMNRVPKIEVPAFHAAGEDPESWIKPGDKPQTFRTVGQKRDVDLMPLNQLFDRRYSVYWEVS
jgi:DUF1680 family protein